MNIGARCKQLTQSELYPEEEHLQMTMLCCAARPWEALGHKKGVYCLVAIHSIDAIIYEDHVAAIPDQENWNATCNTENRVYCCSLYEGLDYAIKALERIEIVVRHS